MSDLTWQKLNLSQRPGFVFSRNHFAKPSPNCAQMMLFNFVAGRSPKVTGNGDPTAQTGPASFLGKLLAMVEDPACQHQICWSPNGRSFIVFRPVELAKEVCTIWNVTGV